MNKIPTKKDCLISVIISISFMLLGAIPSVAYFINVNKKPTLFSDSFFILIFCGMFFIIGFTLFLLTLINLYRLRRLDTLKQQGKNEEYIQYENMFKEYQQKKARFLSLFIPLVLVGVGIVVICFLW